MSKKIVDLRNTKPVPQEPEKTIFTQQHEEPRPEKKPGRDSDRDKPTPELEWSTAEYVYHKKNQIVWIRTAVMIAVPIILLMVLMKNVLGVVLVVFGGGAFLLAAFRQPRTLEYAIRKDGVAAGPSFYAHDRLESFWIFDEGSDKVLSLRRKGMLGEPVTLPLGETSPQKVREAIQRFLPEKEQTASALNSFLKRIHY